MKAALVSAIENCIFDATSIPANIAIRNATFGGCINTAEIVQLSDGRKFFVKSNSNCPRDLFECESTGLAAIAATNTIRVPRVVGNGVVDGVVFLILEAIESARMPEHFFAELGRQLAELHQKPHRKGNGKGKFGFDGNNYIGSTPQINDWEESWCDFWREQRLSYQFERARKLGYGDRRFNHLADRVLAGLESVLTDQERPVLLHGDLWSGNFMVGEAGGPVLIDPAVYFGHREVEFGMTTLFGGFQESFYSSYNERWPLADGWQDRIDIYRLYHLLNHLNLFGPTYRGGCLEIMERYG